MARVSFIETLIDQLMEDLAVEKQVAPTHAPTYELDQATLQAEVAMTWLASQNLGIKSRTVFASTPYQKRGFHPRPSSKAGRIQLMERNIADYSQTETMHPNTTHCVSHFRELNSREALLLARLQQWEPALDCSSHPTDFKKAFRRLAKTYHPDLHQNLAEEEVRQKNKIFAEIMATFEGLSMWLDSAKTNETEAAA